MKGFTDWKQNEEICIEMQVEGVNEISDNLENLNEGALKDLLKKAGDAFRGVADRIKASQEKIREFGKKMADLKAKASATKDPIAKETYEAKIATAQARASAYTAYAKYQQEMGLYQQAKAKEIETRMKARQKRASELTK